MRAILIDPYSRTVIETDIDGSAAAVCEELGSSSLAQVHEFETGDVLYIDEESEERARASLDEGIDLHRAFAFEIGGRHSFLGRGVILGPENSQGVHSEALLPVSRLSSIVFIAPALPLTKSRPCA